MSLVDSSKTPSKSMQRWFGLSLGTVFCIFGWIASSRTIGGLLISLGLILAATYYLAPKSQRAIIRGWQWVTFPLAWTISHILLLTVFLGVVTPLGWIMRMRGYDPLRLRSESASSEWMSRKSSRDPGSYFRQF